MSNLIGTRWTSPRGATVVEIVAVERNRATLEIVETTGVIPDRIGRKFVGNLNRDGRPRGYPIEVDPEPEHLDVHP